MPGNNVSPRQNFMENSKLIGLLRTLTPRERRSFREMVASPYFNRNQDLLRLSDWLDGFAPDYAGASRAAAHVALFPGEAPDDAGLNHLMSFLLKLAEDFVGLEAFKKASVQTARYTLQGLAQRGLDKHYQFMLERTRRSLAAAPTPDAALFYDAYAVEIIDAEQFARHAPRQFNAGVQKATDHLDAFYLLEKLRRTCYMYTSQAILATPYNLQLVEEICRFTGANLDKMPTPAIEAYYRIFQMLTKGETDEDFQALKHLLATRADAFSREDLSDVYQYAINFCNIQIMKVREAYVREAFDLYSDGVASGILLQDGILSPWHFKNIITLALRLKNYDWTEQFIEGNTRLLAPEFQTDARHYNMALLYYNCGRLKESMSHLNKVEFTDIHYSTGAKVMLCQIYYQNDDYDALDSLLHAFNTFLRRNKLLSEDVRRAYLNFIQVMRKILHTPQEQFPAIVSEVEKMRVLAGKEWLLKMLK